jgi:hypothetical protein
MLGGDPRENFIPVGSGEMCPHLPSSHNMVSFRVHGQTAGLQRLFAKTEQKKKAFQSLGELVYPGP